jgi:hypothetical protein
MKISALFGLQVATTLLFAQCHGSGSGAGGGNPPVVTITANPTTIVSGGTSTITVSALKNNQPFGGAAVTYALSGTGGTLSANSGTIESGVGSGTPGESTNTFTGDSPTSTSTVTITATVGGVSKSCTVTVTPLPVTAPVVSSATGGAVTGAPVVTIIPDVISLAKGFKASYAVTMPSGYTLYGFGIHVDVASDFSTGHSSNISPGSTGVTDPTITYSSPQDDDKVTIKSDATKLGTSSWDVILNDPGNPGHVLHAKFGSLPGPTK